MIVRDSFHVKRNPAVGTISGPNALQDVEGCLSFPGFGAPVVRPIWVEAAWGWARLTTSGLHQN